MLGGLLMAVAVAGLVVNAIAFLVLHGGNKDDLNMRGALWHVAGDMLGSVAAIAAAGIIMATGWMNIPDITSVSHVHAWALTETKRLITLEVTAAPGTCIEMVRRDVKARLAHAFDLSHATVEVVSEPL